MNGPLGYLSTEGTGCLHFMRLNQRTKTLYYGGDRKKGRRNQVFVVSEEKMMFQERTGTELQVSGGQLV